jgi:hypothetical protein
MAGGNGSVAAHHTPTPPVDQGRDGGKIGMITGVAKIMLPDHAFVLDGKQTGHQLRIADRAASEIAFYGRPDPACDHPRRQHLPQRATRDAEEAIEPQLGIGDSSRFRPKVGEKRDTFLGGTLMDEENPWIRRVVLRRPADVADCFPREESAVMPQEDEECSTGQELIAQRSRLYPLTNHRLIECRHKSAHHILARFRASIT